MAEKRSSFTGKIGFVLAAAGSAVGLGNIWRFPYLAASYGGGIFLLVYLILALTLGFCLMCAEIAIGRKTGKSAIDAFASLNKKYTFIGWLAAIVPIIILPYYSVIGGWVIKYFFIYVSGDAHASAVDGYFDRFIGGTVVGSVFFLLVFFAALTSSISLMETVVSLLRDKAGWGRRKCCLIVFIGSIVIGLPSALGFGLLGDIRIGGMTLLDMFDFISNSVLMPIVALLTCLFVGYVLKPEALIEEMEIGGKFTTRRLFTVIIKYVAPICIVLILISSVLDGLGIVKI